MNKLSKASFANLFKTLGNEKRLEIVQTLAGNELSVTQLMKITGIGQSSISQHLGILREAEVVRTRRSAQIIYYSLACKKTLKILSCIEEISRIRY